VRPITVVFIGGHLHGWEGGKRLDLVRNGAPYLSFTTRRAADDAFRYDSQYYPTRLDLDAGDALSIRAVYDNPTSAPDPGAMGIVEMYYYER
jgi:hypothetical protein